MQTTTKKIVVVIQVTNNERGQPPRLYAEAMDEREQRCTVTGPFDPADESGSIERLLAEVGRVACQRMTFLHPELKLQMAYQEKVRR